MPILQDPEGRKYDTKILDPSIVKEDALVKKVFKLVERLQAQVIKSKAKIKEIIDKHLEGCEQSTRTTWKGNTELRTFDDSMSIRVDRASTLEADSRIGKVCSLLEEYATDATSGLKEDVKALVEEALPHTNDPRPRLKKLQNLQKLNIKDARWQEAMQLFSKCVRRVYTKQRQTFYRRGKDGRKHGVVLDYNRVEQPND